MTITEPLYLLPITRSFRITSLWRRPIPINYRTIMLEIQFDPQQDTNLHLIIFLETQWHVQISESYANSWAIDLSFFDNNKNTPRIIETEPREGCKYTYTHLLANTCMRFLARRHPITSRYYTHLNVWDLNIRHYSISYIRICANNYFHIDCYNHLLVTVVSVPIAYFLLTAKLLVS